MTGCLNGGSCLFGLKKDKFSCSRKLPWTGEECGVKTGKKLDDSIELVSNCRIGYCGDRTIKLLPGVRSFCYKFTPFQRFLN